MRRELVAALAGLVVGLGLCSAEEAPPEESGPGLEEPAPAKKGARATDRETSGEAGLPFGQGLPPVTPAVVPALPRAAAINPFTPLYTRPPPGPVGPDGPVPGGGRFWADVEYLNWWMKDAPLPSAIPGALLTTGAATDPAPGVLAQRNTQGIYDRANVDYGGFAGMRLTAGGWFDPDHCVGAEVSGFVFEKRSVDFAASSDAAGNPVLAFRHLDPYPRATEDDFIAAIPRGGKVGPYSGGVAFDASSQLWGTEANLVHALCWGPCLRVRVLGGFRYLDLNEDLDFFFRRMAVGSATLPFLGRRFPAGSFELAGDVFHTRTQFYGGQIGMDGQFFHGPFFAAGGFKVGFGDSQQVVSVFGQSVLQPARGAPVTASGGLFALPGNSGVAHSDQFSVVPQVHGKIGVQATPWLRGFVGYEFLYWSGVVRPGSQVDQRVDARAVPTDPAFTGAAVAYPHGQFNRTDFWAQGLTFGLELAF